MTLEESNELFSRSIQKKMRLVFSNNVIITNSEICSEEMSLEESLFSDSTLRLGACESSCFKVRVVNSGSFKGETIVVEQLVTDDKGRIVTDDGSYLVDENGNHIVYHSDTEFGLAIPYGTFKVQSDEPSNDRMWRDLTCYDAMYDIINADVAAWYRSLTFPMTIKALRDSFFSYLGVTQVTTTLMNDSLTVGGNFTVDGTLSGKTVIEAICELNACFGHINHDNQFEYITIPSQDTLEYKWYIDGTGKYEDYTTDLITGIVARGESGDVGTSVGTNVNPYYITDNPLVYGLEGTTELSTALTNILNAISTFVYRPFTVETYGNPFLKIGTNVRIKTKKYDPQNGYSDFYIESLLIKRELVGIQALKDIISAEGEKEQKEEVNNISSEIKRTKGRMHIIENTVDTFKSEIVNIESIVAYTVNMRSLGSFQFTVMGDFLTEEEYENLIGTETTVTGHDIDIYFPATGNEGKYFLEANGGGYGLPILYVSDGTNWNESKRATTALATQSNSRIWEHESQENSKLVGFVLENNLNYIVAVRLNADITPSANGLCLQFDLPGLPNSVNRICTRPVYKQGQPFTPTDLLYENQLIYLQYVPYSDISDGQNPYGFKYVWNMLEDNIQRSTSLIEQLSNQIVLKVDSNGHLAEVNLSADPDTSGTTLELTADNINFNSFNLNMQTTNFELTANGFVLNKNGLIIGEDGSGFVTKVTPNEFSISQGDFIFTAGSGFVTCEHESLNKYVSLGYSDIIRSSAWGGINTSLNESLSFLADIGSTQSAEPSAVSVASSTWRSVATVLLPPGRWLILGTARFESNSTGRRGILFSTSSSVSGSDNAVGQLAVNSQSATSGSYTYVQTHWITNLLTSQSTTFYLHGWQNSGSALSVLGRIKAIRISGR